MTTKFHTGILFLAMIFAVFTDIHQIEINMKKINIIVLIVYSPFKFTLNNIHRMRLLHRTHQELSMIQQNRDI